MNDSIRTIEPGDIGWIISKHGLVYTEEFNFDLNFEIDIAHKVISLCAKQDAFTRIWIKQVNNKNAASIAISRQSNGAAFINFLLVLKQYRGKGIAGELMQHALDYARQNQLERVRLETYSCLKNARGLYRNLGFGITGQVRRLDKYNQRFDQEFWELELIT